MEMGYSKELAMKMYETMVKIRTFEQAASELFYEGRIPGSIHLYIGQEAVAAGAFGALNPDDFVVTTHRGHGHIIAKGGDVKYMMSEIFGKANGYCRGKGGSMHIADPKIGLIGANGIVGAGINIALGPALYAQCKNTKQVSVCFFGDGASNQSTFHESLNLSGTWKLPVIYICENNLYGMSVSKKRHQSVDRISSRAIGYDMAGVTVDGNTPFAVYDAVSEAAARARRGDGPTLIECLTYIHHPHSEGFDVNYRPKEEIAEWIKKDPIVRMERLLLEKGFADPDAIQKIKNNTEALVKEAVVFAQGSPDTKPEEAIEDVYSDIVVGGRAR